VDQERQVLVVVMEVSHLMEVLLQQVQLILAGEEAAQMFQEVQQLQRVVQALLYFPYQLLTIQVP
jgi:hypothetical protein